MAFAFRDEFDKKYKFTINSIDIKRLRKGKYLSSEIGKIVLNEIVKDDYLRIRKNNHGTVYLFTNSMIEQLEDNNKNSKLIQNSIDGKVFKNSSETYIIKLKD